MWRRLLLSLGVWSWGLPDQFSLEFLYLLPGQARALLLLLLPPLVSSQCGGLALHLPSPQSQVMSGAQRLRLRGGGGDVLGALRDSLHPVQGGRPGGGRAGREWPELEWRAGRGDFLETKYYYYYYYYYIIFIL